MLPSFCVTTGISHRVQLAILVNFPNAVLNAKRFYFDFYVSKICIYELGIFHANQTTMCLRNQGRTKGEGWSTAN